MKEKVGDEKQIIIISVAVCTWALVNKNVATKSLTNFFSYTDSLTTF